MIFWGLKKECFNLAFPWNWLFDICILWTFEPEPLPKSTFILPSLITLLEIEKDEKAYKEMVL